MPLLDVNSLPNVLDPDVATGLAGRVATLGNDVATVMSTVHDRWNVLGRTEVFDVAGAEGVPRMLDRPDADAGAFAVALSEARNALWDAGTLTLPALKTRREELAARIASVNQAYAEAEQSWQQADTTYWQRHRADPESIETVEASLLRLDASAQRTTASDAGETLRADIERFRVEVVDVEEQIASRLRGIAGGTDVRGAWGERVRVSQSFWGYVDAPYPGAPGYISSTQTLSERLTGDLSDAVVRRISWLAEADRADVDDWLTAHPDFTSAVAFVEPQRASKLWAEFADASTAGMSADGQPGQWSTGPLAHLLAAAPLVVGNLNGIPAAQRHLFNRAGLGEILARDDLDEETRTRLTDLASRLDERPINDHPRAQLLSLFLDTDGSPRASLAWGDVDTADQITTMTHGIRADLGSYDEWSLAATNTKVALDLELRGGDSTAETAVVLFMDWDSGGLTSVFGTDLPDAGAARLTQTLSGFEHVNPDAERNIAAHSLGTTMAAQSISDNPGLVQNAWFFGSAGVANDTGRVLEEQIAAGELSVHATHASADDIAGWGRTDWLGSVHTVDPRTLSGVTEFGSDGGFVAGYGDSGEWGLPTDSHDAHGSTAREIERWDTGIDGSPVPTFTTVTRTGYLDQSAESFQRMIVGLTDAAVTEPPR